MKKRKKFIDAWNRRDFLEFVGTASVQASIGATILPSLFNGCAQAVPRAFVPNQKIPSLAPSSEDRFSIAKGFEFREFIRYGQSIGEGISFGYNNDFIGIIPIDESGAWLWVNHEFAIPYLIHPNHDVSRTKERIDFEMKTVGGSVVRIKKQGSKWVQDNDTSANFRVDGNSKIPFSGSRKVAGTSFAIGSMGNCGGGKTPWGTILTCEEIHEDFYGSVERGKTARIPSSTNYEWYKFYDHPPEHYGWVVEVNPSTRELKKHVAMGRFYHEGATVRLAKGDRPVVYMGDDDVGHCVFKFVGDRANSLDSGTLYAADTVKGVWIPLNKKNKKLSSFKNDLEILTFAHEAAIMAGGTKQDRPEDIEINPLNGDVFISLTNNKPIKNYYGSILKISEEGGDPLSLKFKATPFLTGGPKSGVACPDNLMFDKNGNLWITSDISGLEIGKPPYYEGLGNNSLFVVPTVGPQAGIPVRIANGPIDAELTGPCLSPDGKTLFLSVQHPGEGSAIAKRLTSHWPDGGSAIPVPAVVAITGPALVNLTA